MGKIVWDMSMSLDGYVAASNMSPEEPLGVGGEQLHAWAAGNDPQSRALLDESSERLGAMITGRRTYDDSLRWWGPNGPTGEARVPLFVLTHRESPAPDPNSVYTFVSDLESLVEQARVTAAEKDIGVSGIEIGRLLLQMGELDEIWIHVSPLLFGGGLRLYELDGGQHIQLELDETVGTPDAVHIRYKVARET